MSFVRDLISLFYPETCITCDANLVTDEKLICLTCRSDLPFTYQDNFHSNSTTKIFEGRVSIVRAGSFLSYKDLGKAKKIIHELKYRGRQEIGTFIGNWYGSILVDSQQFSDIDCIIPVPLHPSKQRKRGYNQLSTFGKALEKKLKAHFVEDTLIRTSFTKTQTKKSRLERYQNTSSKFVLINTNILTNKHILLIDDVVTTGATLIACCKELEKAEGIKISIITMAVTD